MRRIIIAVLVWGVFYMGTTHALNFEITKPQQNIVYLNEYMSGIGVSAVGITGKCKKDNCNYWVYIGNKRIPVSEETNLVGKGLYNSGSFALVANKKDVYVLNYKGRKTYITRQPLLGCLALSSSIIRVSNTGSPICLTSEKLYTNTKTLELPIGAVDPTIGTSYAGEWIAAYVGEDYNVYVGDTKGFNKLDVGLHSLSDLKDVVRIFPINKSQSLLSVYVYTNKRNKSLMLYQLTDFNNDKDRKVIGLPIINTIETDAGLNPSVYTTKDKKIVVSTKSLTSELQYLIDSSYFNTPEFFSNPHYEKDWVELLVGAGIRHTTWSVDQSVKAPGEGRVSIAKTKYTLDRVGIDTFKAEVEKRAEISFSESRPYEFTERGDRIGWVKGIDNKHHLTVFIENGRILDIPNKSLKTGMKKIAEIHQGDFRLTANQNLIIAGVAQEDKASIEKIARESGLIDDNVSNQRKSSMACVAFPTCPLAMAEAERYLPKLVDDVETILSKNGLAGESIILRVTGCPNGCGRAMLAEIGLVGKGPGKYNMYLGSNLGGTRIPKLYKENLNEQEILTEIDSLTARWAAKRNQDEAFGDFAIRSGIVSEVKISVRDFYDD